jgi:2,4-dienoyl-CoA reductase-like NADH-dependent reductase (Old Yellow Enzyme family)
MVEQGAETIKLLTPVRVGAIELKNRVVMAALTRQRADYES